MKKEIGKPSKEIRFSEKSHKLKIQISQVDGIEDPQELQGKFQSDIKKLVKELNALGQRIEKYLSTGDIGDEQKFLELSKQYHNNKNRVHKDILHQYADLFAVIGIIREFSVLGIQHIDLMYQMKHPAFQSSAKRYESLQPVMIKYRDVFDEIICLTENGYTDGAMQRWRTLFEYSVIILFILQQGEGVATAYIDNFHEALDNDLGPKMNFTWAKAAPCLKDKKQISIKIILEHLDGIDPGFLKFARVNYKLSSQMMHGSAFGVRIAYNTDMSECINDLRIKNADYCARGISTAISHTMILFHRTCRAYMNTFPHDGLEPSVFWSALLREYTKIFKHLFDEVQFKEC